jgi:hypothetical protein
LHRHLDYTIRPLLSEPHILDIDTTVKRLYDDQEGAVMNCRPRIVITGYGRSAPGAGGRRCARQMSKRCLLVNFGILVMRS